jgi:UPF0755 protein
MGTFAQFLEREFERAHRFTVALSGHWREHTNRRTIIILLLSGTIACALYLFVIRPPDNFPTGELVTVPAGESVPAIAATLQANGVIRSPLAFRVISKLLGEDRQLHAGDYLFKEPKDVFSITKAIAIGAYGLEPFRIRVPEGATIKEMASIFSAILPRFDRAQFLAHAQKMEGYLFPDTYFFLPNVTADTVIQTMRQNFDTHEAVIDAELKTSGKPLADIVIMASILEREARNYQDRQMIAGVLWRRMRLGMPLQTDATFLYTIGKGSAQLTIADLASDSPYNTYTHKGLPPTPIGSPSLSSLEAAATPIDKGYLFYLADSNGVTHFSKTYAGQQQNERIYLGK